MDQKHYEYNLASPDRYMLLKDFAKKNKAFATEAERALWSCLRSSQLGVKFNRQHIIGDFIVDFVCINKSLIIEVDGGYHSEFVQEELDSNRTKELGKMGFEVIRFSNEEVLSDIEKVKSKILNYINEYR